ncbi:WAT1-related protein [Drosera capensis]
MKLKRETAVPFALMVLMEGFTSALTITAGWAMDKGMNQFVFVAYSNALSSIILLPYSLIFHKDSLTQLLNFRLLGRFFLLGLIGVSIAQNLAFTGLRLSSPIVACGMGLLLPSFQFVLALILRKMRLNLRNSSIQIMILGAMISVVGAVVISFYKGPSILQTPIKFHPHVLQGKQSLELLMFNAILTEEHWVIGGILLLSATFFIAVWGIIQVSTINKFPDMMLIVTSYIICGTLQTTVVDILAERNLSAWKLQLNYELAIIVSTAIFGTLIRSRVQAWCMTSKGPMYVSMFKPLGIFWSCVINLTFFGSSLHYGSVLGASIVGMGYFLVLWGIRREDEGKKNDDRNMKVPLLQDRHDQV